MTNGFRNYEFLLTKVHFRCLMLTDVEILTILPYMERSEHRITYIPQIFPINQ